MWTYHYDTFMGSYRLYKAGRHIAIFMFEDDLLEAYPRAVKV